MSPDDPKRDLVDKRREYARAGIPEYWIINPQTETIMVLHLAGERYVEHGVFARGENATSATIANIMIDVTAVLEAD